MPVVEERIEVVPDDGLEEIPVLPSEPVPRRAVLLRAAELVDEHGYISCRLGGKGVGFCLLGAIHEAGVEMGYTTAYDRSLEPTNDRVYEWASGVIGTPMVQAYGWSDMLDDRLFAPAGVTSRSAKERLAAGLRKLAGGTLWRDVTNNT